MCDGMDRQPPPLIDAGYDARAAAELEAWQAKVLKGPSLMGRAARGAQVRINRMIPEKVHATVTTVMFLGPLSRVTCTLDDGTAVVAQLASSEALRLEPGQRVRLVVDPAPVLVVA